jgi:hypothetical protein
VGAPKLTLVLVATLGCGSVAQLPDGPRSGGQDHASVATDGGSGSATDAPIDAFPVPGQMLDADRSGDGAPDVAGAPVVWDSPAARWDQAVWR